MLPWAFFFLLLCFVLLSAGLGMWEVRWGCKDWGGPSCSQGREGQRERLLWCI